METTVNMRKDILRQIARAAEFKGISQSEMIVLLIKNVMNEITDPTTLGRMVRYQERSSASDWHTFHVCLRMEDYEFVQDLRKIRKMSISLIIAYAVKKYLIQVLQQNNNTDNYRFTIYLITREVIDSSICWRIIWGNPPYPATNQIVG